MGINEYIKVGERIKNLRIAKGMKQKTMADKLNIKTSTYSNYENGHREPKLGTIKKISEILNTPVSVILDPSGESYTEELQLALKANNSFNTTQYLERASNSIADAILAASNRPQVPLLENYAKLNYIGQVEAEKRVEELTHIEKYTKKDPD